MATITINNQSFGNEWAAFQTEQSALEEVALRVETFSGGSISIDWGDGTIEFDLPHNVEYTHTYSGVANFLGIKADIGLEDIKGFYSNTIAGLVNLTGNVDEFDQLPAIQVLYPFGANLQVETTSIPRTVLQIATNSPINGNVNGLPPNITQFSAFSGSLITGNISDIPLSTTLFSVSGASSIGGDLSGLKENLTHFTLFGTGNVTGNLASLPAGLILFNVGSPNDIAGNIGILPSSLTYFSLLGSNAVSGNLHEIPVSLTYFNVHGFNIIGGSIENIQPGMSTVRVTGNNTVNGNIATIPPNPYVNIEGLNTISGVIDGLPNRMKITGNNTISGNFASLTTISYYAHVFGGNNTIVNSTAKSYGTLGSFYVTIATTNAAFNSAQVDQLINDIVAGDVDLSDVTLSLTGPAIARTAASDTAYNDIIAAGGIIILNTN